MSQQELNDLLNAAASQQRAGQLAACASSLRAAAALAPGLADLQHDLGAVLAQLGDWGGARAALARALELAPQHAPALLQLGRVLERQEAPAEAEAVYGRLAALGAPRDLVAEAHARLASLAEQRGARRAARGYYLRAVGGLPAESLQARVYGARASLLANDLDTAEALLRAAYAQAPQLAAVRGMLARVLCARGDFTAGTALLEQALAAAPRETGLYYDLVRMRRIDATRDAALVDGMARALGRQLPKAARLRLVLAAAKAADDMGEYARAAAYLTEAGALRAQLQPVNRAGVLAHVEQLAGRLRDRPQAAGDFGAQAVFVLGLPRSGTTLAERCLARHPGIGGAGELGFWGAGVDDPYAEGAWPEAAGHFLARLHAEAPDAGLVVDKNPFNYLWGGLIAHALPGARFVLCRRDFADAALSIMFTALRPQALFGSAPDDLLFCMRQYLRLEVLLREAAGARLHVLGYEKLVEAPANALRAVLGFCGLGWAPECLTPEADARPILTASVFQARQGIHGDSVGRWRHYAGLLHEFTRLEGESSFF